MTRHLTQVAALLLVLAGCTGPLADPRSEPHGATRAIVNGEVCAGADAVCAPTGAILTRGEVNGSERAGMVCSGVLIAPDVVLTAGHCTEIATSFYGGQGQGIENYFTLAGDVQVFGRSTSNPPAPSRRIAHLIAHPDYDRANFALFPVGLARLADLGLGLLAEGYDDVAPAMLPGGELGAALAPGLDVDIVGYGRTAADASDGVKLRAASFVNELNDTELQVGDVLPTPMTCLGDSGGPTLGEVDDGLLPSQRLLAVTSRAYDASVCEVGGVATRTDAFRDWIDATLRAACADGLREPARCVDGGGLARPQPYTGWDDAGDSAGAEDAVGCACQVATAQAWPAWLLLPALAWRRGRRGGPQAPRARS